jgi:hypothetical protein
MFVKVKLDVFNLFFVFYVYDLFVFVIQFSFNPHVLPDFSIGLKCNFFDEGGKMTKIAVFINISQKGELMGLGLDEWSF